MGQKKQTVALSNEHKLTLTLGRRKVAEIEFSVPEQKFEISFMARRGASSNPVLLFVDTQFLEHTEDDEN